jgi:hypothetical protein
MLLRKGSRQLPQTKKKFAALLVRGVITGVPFSLLQKLKLCVDMQVAFYPTSVPENLHIAVSA